MLKRQILLLLLVCSTTALSAQERIGLSLDRNNVLVGDPVKLKIDIQLPTDARILGIDLGFDEATLIPTPANPVPGQMTPVPDNIDAPDFEVSSLGKWTVEPDTNFVIRAKGLVWDTLTGGSTTIFTNTIEIIPWDAGIIKLPPMLLGIVQGTTQRSLTSNAIELKVNAPSAPASINPMDSIGLAPIKTIKREPFKIQDTFPFLIALLILSVLGVLVWSFLRTKKPVVPPPPVTKWIPVHELALAQLHQLKGQQLWQQGKVKDYQSQLTHIVRSYLENRYHIQALESTTPRILSQLKALSFSDDHKKQLQEMLQMADMVKFAKASPEVTAHDRLMENAVTFVKNTQPKQLLDENEEGWVEIPVVEEEGLLTYQLIKDETIRKRVTDTAHDFIKFEEAPIGRRVIAGLIDTLIVILVGGILVGIVSYFVSITSVEIYLYVLGGLLFILFIFLWIYFVEMEVRSGLTPGKRIMSLQTMNATQDNISRVEAVIRIILKKLSLLLLPIFIIYTMMKKSRILFHDQMTDTRVYFVKK